VKQRDWRSLPEMAREEAIAWHARLKDGDASGADYSAFGEWIVADADNAAAYEAVEMFDSSVDAFARTKPASASTSKVAPGNAFSSLLSRPQMRYAALAASLLAVVALGLISATKFNSAPAFVEQFASSDTPRTIALGDGTSVVLAPGAEMSVRIDPKSRRITEFRGAGFFHVAPDAARPFTIAFGGKTVTVVGTQFEVCAFPDRQSVSVLEGVVRVGSGKGNFAPVSLKAGDKAEMNGGVDETPRISSVAAEEIAPWRDGVLEFAGASLTSVAEALNDIYGGETFVTDAENVDKVTFNGVLQVAAPDVVARRLEELLPVEAENSEGKFHLHPDDRRAPDANDEN